MDFKDHFSKVSEEYARFRPRYPGRLFSYLASLTPMRKLAWDCATGSGQAAVGLANFFERVVASDASASQIENAPSHPRITYRVMAAEKTDIESDSLDLVTVGQALHWFDLEAFYGEVRRTLRPGGALAVWAYGLIHPHSEVQEILVDYYHNVVGEFWPPEREKIEQGYRTVPFPFEEIEAPVFHMAVDWSIAQLEGYLGTWSASLRFKEKRGLDPVALISGKLSQAWGAKNTHEMTWPIHLRIGRKP